MDFASPNLAEMSLLSYETGLPSGNNASPFHAAGRFGFSGIYCNIDNNRSKRSYFKHDLYHLPASPTTNTI
jgi:hypothetical protein